MIDREKVIKGLEMIVADDKMWRKADYYATICKEALELLKAQEPIKPVWLGGENEHIGFYACGSCGMNMGTNPNYCWYCGRKVKWDG